VKSLDRLCRRLGFLVVPLPPPGKMLREHANVCEAQHRPPHYGTDGCVVWLRRVASAIEDVR
jgi:hypothetical protein